MTKLERNILKSVRDNLIDSTITDWTNGSIEEWTILGRRMLNTIAAQAAILETLFSEETNPIVEPKLPED